jgi:AAA+ superfamily predicted ATPase
MKTISLLSKQKIKKMKLNQFSPIVLLCVIVGTFSPLEGFSQIDYHDDFGNPQTAHYKELNLQCKPHVEVKPLFQPHIEVNPRVTAILTPGSETMKVSTKIDLDERQIGEIIKAIFQQLPTAADKSAGDIKESFQTIIGSMINTENAIRYGYPLAFWTALSLSGIYGSRVLWKVIEKKLIDPKPDIILPGSKYGYWDRIKRWRNGYSSPPMIFDQQVKYRLTEIQEKTKTIRNHIHKGKTASYDNLLLYGKPGTGKTLFAQILADYTDMDLLPVTAASLLQSGVEGIQYFNELLDMAHRSKYGIILFVDEADALFIDRDNLDPSSDHYKVLNHILALTGTGSSKFMLIAATNHAYVMDAAMGRRFQDRVLMPLPDEATRKELITLYCNSVLYNETKNSEDFIDAAESLLTQQVTNCIAQKTAGLSHAEIKDMVYAMHKKALCTETGIIAAVHINDAVNQAIEKARVLQVDKSKREQRFESNKAN